MAHNLTKAKIIELYHEFIVLAELDPHEAVVVGDSAAVMMGYLEMPRNDQLLIEIEQTAFDTYWQSAKFQNCVDSYNHQCIRFTESIVLINMRPDTVSPLVIDGVRVLRADSFALRLVDDDNFEENGVFDKLLEEVRNPTIDSLKGRIEEAMSFLVGSQGHAVNSTGAWFLDRAVRALAGPDYLKVIKEYEDADPEGKDRWDDGFPPIPVK